MTLKSFFIQNLFSILIHRLFQFSRYQFPERFAYILYLHEL